MDWDEEKRVKQVEARERIAEYLAYFTDLLVDRIQSYNAVKHGLAMQAGEPKLKVGQIEELSLEGPAISNLDRRHDEDGKSQWVVTTRWIPLELDLSLAYIGTRLLASLWQVARVRYGKWPIPEGGFELTIPATPISDIRKAANGADPQVVITEISFPPAMYAPPGSGVDALIAEMKNT